MKYLLDTHALLWSLYDSRQLPIAVKQIMSESECAISIASLWEIAIKTSIGKLMIKQSIQEIAALCLEQEIAILDIAPLFCDVMMDLPRIHHDPFDRIIIATAMAGNYTIATKDSIISQYQVQTIWDGC